MPSLNVGRGERAAIVAVILFAAVFLISGFFLGGVETFKQIGKISPGLVAALLLLALVNYVVRALRWHLFAGALGVRVPLRLGFLYYFAGFSMTMTPGKVGEVLRLWFLRRRHGYRYDRTAGLVIADRLFDANAMIVLMLGSVAGVAQHSTITLLAAAAAIILSGLFIKPTLMLAAVNAVAAYSPRRVLGLLIPVRRALRHLERLASYRLFGAALLISIVGWLAEALSFAILLQAFDAKIALLGAIFIFAFSMIVGALFFLPGGLGGVEATMIGLLMGAGVSFDVGLAATAIIRLTTLWFAVGLGFLALAPAMRASIARRAGDDRNPESGAA